MSGHNAPHKVLVIGGGYAGTLAANRLRMRDDVGNSLVVDSATRIDADARTVHLASGSSLRAQAADTAMNFHTGGRITAGYKELTCKLGLWKIRREVRKPGSPSWLKGRERVVAAA